MRQAVRELDVESAVRVRYSGAALERVRVEAADARPFPCAQGALLCSPRETKGEGYDVTTDAAPIVCTPGGDFY